MIDQAKVAILLPVYNRAGTTLRAVEQLLALGFTEGQITVIDDGSPDNTGRFLCGHFSDINVLYGNGDEFWSGSLNRGLRKLIKEDKASYVLILNDDLEFHPQFYEELVRVFAGSGEKAIVGAVALVKDDSGRNLVRSCGSTRRRWVLGNKLTGADYNEVISTHPKGVLDVEALSGHVLFSRLATFREVGFFDEIRFRQYFGDADFTLRAFSRGYRIRCALRSVVWDDKNQTGVKVSDMRLRWGDLRKILCDWRSAVRVKSLVPFYRRHFSMPVACLVAGRIYLRVFSILCIRSFLGRGLQERLLRGHLKAKE